MMEFVIAILIGIGLSATVGFRIFTPLLITSIAEKASLITLADGFDWIGSTPALIAFFVATLLEIGANYIPVVDSLLKTLSTPVATIAGILLTASFIGDMDPFFTWGIAIIAGGGTATISQLTTSSLKNVSTITTGGSGNIFISIFEGVMAVVMSLVSLFMPFFAIIFVMIVIVAFIFIVRRLRNMKQKKWTHAQ